MNLLNMISELYGFLFPEKASNEVGFWYKGVGSILLEFY